MALPVQPWEWAVFKTVRVHIDSHVEFEGHRYSVPNALVGLALELRVTAHAVEALHRGNRVASHMRCAHKGGFTTVTEHLPERHQHQAQWTPERLVTWGERIGVACAATVRKMLERQRHPEHGSHEDVGGSHLLAMHHERNGGAGKVNEQLLASAVNLPHGALETFGKLAVVLAELRVAPRFDRVVCTVLVADLGAVFLPQQHEGHALAAQLLVNAPVVGLGVSVAGRGEGTPAGVAPALLRPWLKWPLNPAQRRQPVPRIW